MSSELFLLHAALIGTLLPVHLSLAELTGMLWTITKIEPEIVKSYGFSLATCTSEMTVQRIFHPSAKAGTNLPTSELSQKDGRLGKPRKCEWLPQIEPSTSGLRVRRTNYYTIVPHRASMWTIFRSDFSSTKADEL